MRSVVVPCGRAVAAGRDARFAKEQSRLHPPRVSAAARFVQLDGELRLERGSTTAAFVGSSSRQFFRLRVGAMDFGSRVPLSKCVQLPVCT
jgi:hypothetical protein